MAQTAPGAFASIYQWLADLLVSKGAQANDQILLWLRGATEANAGRGSMSALIREYTAAQIRLRYGQTVEITDMQRASDAVAKKLIEDLLGETDQWPRGKVPDIERIANRDALAVGEVLFRTVGGLPSRDDNDTPATQNSAWSGALLFGLLKSDQAMRLMAIEDTNRIDNPASLSTATQPNDSFLGTSGDDKQVGLTGSDVLRGYDGGGLLLGCDIDATFDLAPIFSGLITGCLQRQLRVPTQDLFPRSAVDAEAKDPGGLPFAGRGGAGDEGETFADAAIGLARGQPSHALSSRSVSGRRC